MVMRNRQQSCESRGKYLTVHDIMLILSLSGVGGCEKVFIFIYPTQLFWRISDYRFIDWSILFKLKLQKMKEIPQ